MPKTLLKQLCQRAFHEWNYFKDEMERFVVAITWK
jgi:hypothetical protein